jgi:hypothetical protein
MVRHIRFMACGLDQYITERLARLKGLASQYNVKLGRIRYDYTFEYRYDHVTEKFTVIDVVGYFDPQHIITANKFREEARKLYEIRDYGVKGLAFKIQFRLNPTLKGMKCPPLREVVPLMGSRVKRKTVKPRQGEVTLLYFWNTSSERAVKYLHFNKTIFDTHPDWVGKLRLMEFSTDESFDSTIKATVYQKWERIEHYWMSKQAWEGIWHQIPEKSGPYYVLVDKEGRIALSGDADWVQLGTNLDRFMRGEEVTETYGDDSDDNRIIKCPVKDPTWTLLQYRRDLDTFLQTRHEDIDHTSAMVIDVDFHKIIRPGQETKLYGTFAMRYNWFPKYKEAHERIKNDAKKLFLKRLQMRVSDNEKQMYKIEFGTQCKKCSKPLGECDQFRCAVCTKEETCYFCVECAAINDKATTLEELVHPHGLYYIQKDSKNFLDEIKIERMKAGKITKAERKHPSTCKLCETKPIQILYKCANCVEYDICYSCFKICGNPAHEKYAEKMRKVKEHRHDPTAHVFVREDFLGMLAYYF